MIFVDGVAATSCLLPQVNWRGWWARRGQWERSGAESSGRLYYSVVPLPAADASPAQPVAPQHPLVNGLYSVPTSATSAGGVPDALLSGLQCRVTGRLRSFRIPLVSPPRLLSSFFLHLFFSCTTVVIRDERSRSEWVWLCVDALLQGDRHGCRVECWSLSSPRFLLHAGAEQSAAGAACAQRYTQAEKSKRGRLLGGGWPHLLRRAGPSSWTASGLGTVPGDL